MAAPVDFQRAAEGPVRVSSEYVDQMPKLREFAAMDADDPRRRVVREELILAFLPLVEHVAADTATAALRSRNSPRSARSG